MIMVRLLISEGSWLVLRVAENATRPVPERTDMPSALPDGSAVGLESHTTRHFPSNVMGSVSFWQRTSEGSKRSKENTSPTKTAQELRQGREGGDTQGIALGEGAMWGGTSLWFTDRTSQVSAPVTSEMSPEQRATASWMERNDQRLVIQQWQQRRRGGVANSYYLDGRPPTWAANRKSFWWRWCSHPS